MTSYLRYKQQLRIVQDADDIESWITVRGNHIPIKKGQSKEEAVKEFIGNKNDKELSERANKPQTLGEGLKKVVNQTKKNKELYEASGVGKKEKWSGAWNKRANKPITLGEATKNTTSIAKMTKMSASERNEEVGYPMLEIAYSDVNFTEDPEKNRSELSKAIKESEHENAELMQTVLSNLSGEELKDADSVRKGINNYMKSYNTKKNENKEESKKDESWGGAYPKFNELTEKYMPKTGESDNELGEVLRSINQVAYRFYNDGDMWNKGYGKETVNWAVKHLTELAKNKNTPRYIARGLENGLFEMKKYGIKDKDRYETSLKILMQTMEFADKSDIDALANIKKSTSKKTTDSWKRLWGKK